MGRRIEYTYDTAGNRTSITTPSGTTLLGFDALNRLVSVTDADGGITSFAYDEVNNVRVATFPNGTTRTDTYDPLHRLTLREHRNAGGVFASYQFTLGPTGNRTQVVENTGRTVQYAYDSLYRLTQEKITDATAGNRTIDYTLDAVGNRLTRADSVEGATTSTYDDNDQLLSETLGGVATTYTYDANGNTLTRVRNAANRATYRWDFQNRLAGADVTEAGATKQLAYQYDDEGIRVAAFVDGDETRYLIDANRPFAQVVEEYAPNGTVRAAYTHGPHHLISQSRAGARTWYHADGLGSTRALTSQSGTPTDRYQFDAYGRTLTQTGPTENTYLYAGEQRDKNLGLDYLRARYLNFGAGRFYGRDPMSELPQIPAQYAPYVYATSNPVNHSDPSGMFSIGVIDVPDFYLKPLGYGINKLFELGTLKLAFDLQNEIILPAYQLQAASLSTLADATVTESAFYRSYELAVVALRIGYSTFYLNAYLDDPLGFAEYGLSRPPMQVLSAKANSLATELRNSGGSPNPFLLISALGNASQKWGAYCGLALGLDRICR